MRCWYLLAPFLCLALFLPARATAQAPEATRDLGANAAMKYWTAFALLPTLDKDQEPLLKQWGKVPLDPAVLKLLEMSQGSREYLHRGAKLQSCDWSLNYEDGLVLSLPYLAKSRTLAQLTALHARHEFEQGHWTAGAEDVTSLLRLARHLEMEPIMIVQNVGFQIETIAIEAAVLYLPESKPVLPEALSVVLYALPARPTVPQVILKEKQVLTTWLIRRLREDEQHKEGAWRAVWKEFGKPDESVKTLEQAITMVEGMRPFFDELAKVAALPWNEFDPEDGKFYMKTKAANPLAAVFIHPMVSLVGMERRNQIQMALFKAALAVVQDGTDQLKNVKDPSGNGPFEYRVTDNGFELKAKLLFNSKPVMLRVGNGKKG
jgi:hypothetical protein